MSTTRQFKLTGKTILAPMAGINDVAFRLLCKQYGCALTSTEMISAAALSRNQSSALKLIDVVEDERPVSLQLFGSNPEHFAKAAAIASKSADYIDINLGCPASQIVRQGAGCALLDKPSRVRDIVKKAVEFSSVPVTVKMRSGLSSSKIVAVELAKICESAGASAITLHPRTMDQGYSGKADWTLITKIKKHVSIPVIGNGDLNNPNDAVNMMEQTGCDYVMIGRAAMKSPAIFEQISDIQIKRKYLAASEQDRIKIVKTYLYLAAKHEVSFFRTKLHCQHFTAGMQGGARIRNLLSKSQTVDEIRNLLE